jgi:hypothetical protein
MKGPIWSPEGGLTNQQGRLVMLRPLVAEMVRLMVVPTVPLLRVSGSAMRRLRQVLYSATRACHWVELSRPPIVKVRAVRPSRASPS